MLINIIKKEKFIFSIIGLGVIGLCLSLPFFFWQDYDLTLSAKINAEKVAQFGDFIGGVFGSIWALAGVFLFYKALSEQRVDFKNNKEALDLQVSALNQQIDEFKLSREEQILSRKIYEEQSRTLKTQQFESNFYSLLNVYLNIKNNLSKDNNDYFKTLINDINSHYSYGKDQKENSKLLINAYYDIYHENRESLSSYFRSLYRIFNIIKTDKKLTPEDKMFYAKIIRGQISDYELALLYYNSKTHYGENIQQHILNFNLLKHLSFYCKPEFKHILKKQKNNNLVIFSNFINKFLIRNIHLHYDIEFEKDKIEEANEETKIIVGIYFNDYIELKILTEKSVSNNNINITEDDFDRYINDLIYELCINQTYISPDKINICYNITTDNNYRIINIKLETDEKININKDLY